MAIIGIVAFGCYLSYTVSIFAQAPQNISIVSGASSPASRIFYDPSPISISRGTSVIWTNNDNVLHTVISAANSTGEKFNSGPLQPHRTFPHNFLVVGNFAYYCSIYPWMTGKIIVS
jgi:nitrite reductase (NO-forming)